MTITAGMMLRQGAGAVAAGVAGYRIVEHPHGVALYGAVPVSDLLALQAAWEEKGFTLFDVGVASAIGATLCIASQEGSEAWRAEVEADAAQKAGDDRELAWVLGWDTGHSSLCMMAMLAESSTAGARAAYRLYGKADDGGAWRQPPQDPDDLGRCIRLLDRFPAFRDRLDKILDSCPDWRPFVRQWAELEALYRRELARGAATAPVTRARMRALLEEVQGVSDVTVDLSGLSLQQREPGVPDSSPYNEALDVVLLAMVERPTDLPERLFVVVAGDARVLLWSAHGSKDSSLYGIISRARRKGSDE